MAHRDCGLCVIAKNQTRTKFQGLNKRVGKTNSGTSMLWNMVEPLKRHHFITRTNMELFLSCIVTFFKQDVKMNISHASYYFYKKRKIYLLICPNTIFGKGYKNLTMMIASGNRNSRTRRKQEKGDIFYYLCSLLHLLPIENIKYDINDKIL